MTENSKLVFRYLQKNFGKEFSKQEIAKALGVPLASVTGCMNSLIKKGFATTTREETVVDAEATETRKEKNHVVKYHTLTDAGLEFDPEAEEARIAAEKEAAKAARAAERAAKKSE